MTKYVLQSGGIKRHPKAKKDFHRELVKGLGSLPDNFVAQCKQADVIYFHGGDDHLLQYWMKQFNLAKLFRGKVVAGNSAGSDMLATHHWTCDWRQCADDLAAYGDTTLPIYALKEGEYVVFNTERTD